MRVTNLLFTFFAWKQCIAEEHSGEGGFPFYYASFEEVGENRIEHEVQPLTRIDDHVKEWTRDCAADAFVFVKDEGTYSLLGMKPFQRAAENSLTRGSFLSESPFNLQELALDLQDYCDGIMVSIRNASDVEKYIDSKTRIFYLEFTADTPDELKNSTLSELFRIIPTPYVTVAYESTVKQSQPILRSLQTNPRRLLFKRKKMDFQRYQVTPVIAPLFNKREKTESASDVKVNNSSDNFFWVWTIGYLTVAVYLLSRRFLAFGTQRREA